MNENEEKFIGSRIQEMVVEDTFLEEDVENWMDNRARYGEVSQEICDENFNCCLRKNLTIEGVDFSQYLKNVKKS